MDLWITRFCSVDWSSMARSARSLSRSRTWHEVVPAIFLGEVSHHADSGPETSKLASKKSPVAFAPTLYTSPNVRLVRVSRKGNHGFPSRNDALPLNSRKKYWISSQSAHLEGWLRYIVTKLTDLSVFLMLTPWYSSKPRNMSSPKPMIRGILISYKSHQAASCFHLNNTPLHFLHRLPSTSVHKPRLVQLRCMKLWWRSCCSGFGLPCGWEPCGAMGFVEVPRS